MTQRDHNSTAHKQTAKRASRLMQPLPLAYWLLFGILLTLVVFLLLGFVAP